MKLRRMRARFSLSKIAFGIAVALIFSASGARAQAPAAPPRTIADITAILDQEKPDPAILARRRQQADAAPPAQATDSALSDFFRRRAEARSTLGRASEAMADVELAIDLLAKHIASVVNPSAETERQLVFLSVRLEQFRVGQLGGAGLRQPKRSLALSLEMARRFDRPDTAHSVLFFLRHAIQNNIALGNLDAAASLLETLPSLIERARKQPGYATHGLAWEAQFHNARAQVAQSQGDDKVAEVEFLRASDLWFRYRDGPAAKRGSPRAIQISAGTTLAHAGQRKAADGRLAEGEADVRRALLGHLRLVGRHHTATALLTQILALVLMEQGRAADAETLIRSILETYDVLGLPAHSNVRIQAGANLAQILEAQGRWAETTAAYQELQTMTADLDKSQRLGYVVTPSHINALYRTGRFTEGVEVARALVERSRMRVGEAHFSYGLARGYLAAGLSGLGRDSEALKEFAVAMPILTAGQRQAGGDGTGARANQERQTAEVVEAFVELLTRVWTPIQKASFIGEAFRLTDIVRGGAVQGAIAQSSARMAIDDPGLAALARREQDLSKKLGSQYQLLNNVLSLPSSDRDDKVEAGLRAEIAGLQAELDRVREGILRDFPGYADLVNPKPATMEQVQAALKPDESFISIFSGRDKTYVWAVPKDGPAAFAVVPLSAAALDQKVAKLRLALEPTVETIEDIPAFDTTLSAELFDALLKPVEAGWKSARTLVVATNGALAMLPLGVLVTGPITKAVISEQRFAGYRNVPWLSRTHAVTSVPSAATFTTLRRLPAGKASREKLIGFGDPLFNREQAVEVAQASPVQVASATAMRGIPLVRRSAPQVAGKDSVTLASLPRLPDTADELKSIARTLGADPAKALNLGLEANKPKVVAMPLSNYRVIAFATHGLVPGELDGLTQPALALSAPEVTGVGGDGLLKMEEILGLKLDADWVVLSACNTGTGAGAGAEAASGLGRAFFYAGTRALLVTNWSVHSASARDLVSDIFQRQATDASQSRAEALRQAMLGLMDGPGYTDAEGKTLFSYAHPLFWAPYTLIGDGG